jgi:hypothetical protein
MAARCLRSRLFDRFAPRSLQSEGAQSQRAQSQRAQSQRAQQHWIHRAFEARREYSLTGKHRIGKRGGTDRDQDWL